MKRLLVIDDEADVVYSFRRLFEPAGYHIESASSGEEGVAALEGARPDVVIMDVRLGGMSGLETLREIRSKDIKLPVIIMTAYGTTQTAIEAMKLGAFDYVLKPFEVPKLQRLVGDAMEAAAKMRKPVALAPETSRDDGGIGIIGQSEAMQSVFKLIGQLASSDATVLITGESGTGKELIARAIYSFSMRSAQPFLAINCAAIPENLLESELFGHEKGAFTGAHVQRIGKFEQCHEGTLFLDEIGDMAPQTQVKILRVLQSGVFERVGGRESISVNTRVIAATNKNLEDAVAAKEFREDLFYRLNVVRIHVPPLRERKDDIPALVNYFLGSMSEELGRPALSVTTEAMDALRRYRWPGNVRELENTIRRALVIAKGGVLMESDLPQVDEGPAGGAESAVRAPSVASERESSDRATTDLEEIGARLFQWARESPDFAVLPAVERELVIQALKATNGNQVRAAKLLGITRATLRKRIEKFSIGLQTQVG